MTNRAIFLTKNDSAKKLMAKIRKISAAIIPHSKIVFKTPENPGYAGSESIKNNTSVAATEITPMMMSFFDVGISVNN